MGPCRSRRAARSKSLARLVRHAVLRRRELAGLRIPRVTGVVEVVVDRWVVEAGSAAVARAELDLHVQMRSTRPAGLAAVTDDVAAIDALPSGDDRRAEVQVERLVAVALIDDDVVGVVRVHARATTDAAVALDKAHGAEVSRVDRRPERQPEIPCPRTVADVTAAVVALRDVEGHVC